MKGIIAEFKKFVMRGNIVDMAVGVIVGSSFTAIVNALSNNILKPIINYLLTLFFGANSLSEVYTYLKVAYADVLDDAGNVIGQEIDLANSIYIDWGAFINAVINFFLRFENVRGASTITQQLVKNLTGDNEVRVQRKIQEILRAINLDKEKSKEEILEMYLNIVNFSNNCRGVQAAANYFFSKDVTELTLTECASLVAIVNSPYYYDPVRYPERNVFRRNLVLDQMEKYGYLTLKEME